MDEHEVPTHLGAEDRVLLWFTFPQIVALTAVAALAYGVYHVAPVGAEAVRIALALGFALVGVALVAGRVGGRRLPAVVADLLRFAFAPRRFGGPLSQLVRSEPPVPVAETKVDKQTREPAQTVTQQLARRSAVVKRGARKLRHLRRSPIPSKRSRTRGERMPFKPRNWFRKRDRKRRPKREFAEAREAMAQEQHEQRTNRMASCPRLLGGAAALVVFLSVAVCAPPLAWADEHEQESWTSDEIEFEPPPLIPGRRLYIERLTVTRTAATVVLKAAANLEVEARAFGGRDGREPQFQRADTLGRGGRTSYLLPLDGPAPSLTFSWRDEFGQAGALSLAGGQLPYPLPSVEGELCQLRLVSLAWREDRIEGGLRSRCVSALEEPVELVTVSGHVNLRQTVLLPAEVTAVSDTLTVSASGREASVPFLAEGETRFELFTGAGREVLAVEITATLSAELRVPLPPVTQLTHHPHRVEHRVETVTLTRPGTGQTVSKTVTLTDPEGNATTHTISAYLSIPSAQVDKDVTLEIVHPEHVRAEVAERPPLAKTRTETLSLAAGVASDDRYRPLVVPEREPQRPPAVHTRLTEAELNELLALLGWELR